MKYVEGNSVWFKEDDETVELENPYYQLEDGRQVPFEHVYISDWKDLNGQHEAVEGAANDGSGEVICIAVGDDCYHFCNEDRLVTPE